MRVGYDGREYETAGDAVREQIERIVGLPDVDPGEITPGIVAELLDSYRDLTTRVEVAEEAAREAASAAAGLPGHYTSPTEPTNWADGDIWLKPMEG